MSVTVYGKVAEVNGVAAHYGHSGSLLEAHSYTSFKRDLGRRLPVDLDHSGSEIGEIVHVELDERGDLCAVCVCDDEGSDVLAELDHPVYYSAVFSSRSSGGAGLVWTGRDAELLGVALTYSPAMVGQRPVTIVPGDVRKSWSRCTWPNKVASHPLLTRSVATLERRRYGDGLLVMDRRRNTGVLPSADVASRVGRLELRSASTGEVRHHERVVEVLAVPHEVETTVVHQGRLIGEIVTRGAFAGEEQRASRIKINRDHDEQRLVGITQRLDPYNAEGVLAELKISKTVLGDETLALCEDHVLDCSIGFGILTGGEVWEHNRSRRRVNKGFLAHLSLVPTPAYETANVISVRGYTPTR